jgi:hypothetical protein
MRQVEVCKQGWWALTGDNAASDIVTGWIHCFAQQGDSVNGVEPVGVVEFESGLVESIYVGRIRFINKPAAEERGSGQVQQPTAAVCHAENAVE